ncbi:MAG: phosphoglucosamine mutase [Candidatus Syntrophonatronum acetioxidans]|uniref:Phosphoglucosamine mutase n=1 Tax=Candidatus Syntrophonatronum acetioxidans TaxID=1795816 RepID=A0A424YGC5_9FIRM|nr:MAG: phosphoglucosamine mutase [Candidatus Syntrophonatronum acetioxidans]
MGQLFGTDGIRGEANRDLTAELALNISRIGACLLVENNEKPSIVVGRDTRISGDMLEGAIISGITSLGIDVHLAGIISTPGVPFLIRDLKAQGGIMISASHNPVEDNGIKFFDSRGLKLPDELEEKIEEYYFQGKDELPRPPGDKVGRTCKIEDASFRYIDYLKETFAGDLKGLKVVVDCANGALYHIAPFLFEELGARVITLHNCPEGDKINVKCGSTHPEVVREALLTHGADAGFTFDGDGDRLIAVDEKGNIVDGDQIMIICGNYLKERGALHKETVVATIMSNLGMDLAAQRLGLNIKRTGVGDRYVLEAMLKEGYNFGGEQSGHIIFLDHNTTGDGALTALNLAKVMTRTEKPLSQLAKLMERLPQVLKNARVKSNKKVFGNERIQEAINRVEGKLGEKGRVLVRPSGTEPLVRVMLEGPYEDELHIMASEITKVIEEELN